MKEYIVYYLKEKTLSADHKRHISEGMKRWYASTGGMKQAHRQNISAGMKRVWKERKEYWASEGCGER